MNEQSLGSSDHSRASDEDQSGIPWMKPDGVLLHIGPPKTATTSIQYGLSTTRPDLLERGILYPGEAAAQGDAILALQQRHTSWERVLRTDGLGDETISRKPWDELVTLTNAWSGKVVISTEVLASCWPETVSRVVSGLGGQRVQVLVTLRSVMDMAPSIWQQSVKAGLTTPFPEWLSRMLESEDGQFTLRRELLVSRWADAVGPENLAVLFVSAKEPDRTLRALEELIGLPGGLLPTSARRANRSMSAYETEILRRTWELLDRPDIDKGEVLRLIQTGVTELISRRDVPDEESKISLPSWSIPALRAIDEETVTGVKRLGTHVVGDLEISPHIPKDQLEQHSESMTYSEAASETDAAAEVLSAFLRAASRSAGKRRKRIEKLSHRNRKQREVISSLEKAQNVSQVATANQMADSQSSGRSGLWHWIKARRNRR